MSREGEHEMSEKFTAGSGKTYWRGFYGYLQETEGVVLGPKKAEDVKQFFLWERDRELGRWRDPEAPNMVAYPAGDGSVRVRDETDGSGCLLNRESVAENDSGTALTAYRYLKAHPAPRELPTALGTIIEGNGHQAILADLDDEPWRYVGERTLDGGIPVWMSVGRVLELVGPDWRLVHEGMKDDE